MHDRAAFGRILHNLLSNAIKFTDSGRVRVLVRARPETFTVEVVDTGVGMDDAFLPRLFGEFVQASEGHARSHEGAGLGLAITKRLVGLMGGEIAVSSQKDEGTTFAVTLPRTRPDLAPSGDGADTAAQPAVAAMAGAGA